MFFLSMDANLGGGGRRKVVVVAVEGRRGRERSV